MSSPLPLDGIRVVEFTHMVMGPTCGLILADLGADVVKIEPMPDGDKTRRLVGAGAGFFATFNRNKRSVAVDLKSPRGARLVRKLIARADAVIENFRPDAMERLGFGHEALLAEFPRLIYCALKGFLSGPYENRVALDEVVQMMGGLAYMTGPPGRPLRAGASVNDIMGGMFGAIAILAALQERQRTGKGQLVTSALFENNAFLVAQHMAQQAVTGKPPEPMPNRLPAWAIYDIFDTSDGGQLFVGVVTDTQWKLFCEAFHRADLYADATLDTNPKRVTARPRLLPVVAEIIRRHTRAEMMALCERIGLPFAPITRPGDLFDDPQLNQPGGMTEVELDDGRRVRLPGMPVEMAGRRFGSRIGLPKLGADSRALAQEAGLGAAEIAAMLKEGSLGE
ncbi:MAG TPA: CaiB/BaiF CoA-transferase family protein [Candidatus Cybelea sp.]|nr:CaiB/BaiF CoA-transferase family protein [Candidatus Cybelea sp.]